MDPSKFWIRAAAWCLAAASAGGMARAALPAPSASPAGGVFATNVLVSVTGAAPVIRFTLDGSDPSTNSPMYAAPVLITNTALLQARAFHTNGEPGELAAATFTLLETNLADFTSTLPLVIINSFGHPILPGTNNPASVRFIAAPAAGQRTSLTGAPDFDGRAAVKARGYTSLRYPKKSVGFETRTAAGAPLETPLLGFPADSDWILYAPYPDKSLMRDVLAYEWSNKLGHYASRTRFVEAFFNDGSGRLDRSNYVGVYVLEEKLKRAPHRVALQKLAPEDKAAPAVSGGYIFKKDHLEEAGGEGALEAPKTAKTAGWQLHLPSGPGAFPADPAAFVPLSVPSVVSNAISMVTNLVTITNTISSNRVAVVPAWAVTVVGTNTVFLTNVVSVTNTLVATNLVVTSNTVVGTNVAVTVTPALITNALVASQGIAATNAVATTNPVDAVTTVITTTTSITTTTTYRTNYVPATNLVSVTNITYATNLVAHTNPVVTTNIAIAALTVYATNHVIGTNTYVFGPGNLAYLDRLVESGEGFVTRWTNAFFFSEPKPSKITPEQRAWLTNYLNQFEQVLHSPDFRHPTNGYAAYLDVDSFIDHHLFVEVTKNIDGFRFSTFFTKDRGGKIKMEPIWDWNLSFGNARGKQGHLWDRWYWHQLDDQQYSWFRRLFEDPDFAQRYVDRWAAWRTNVVSPAALTARIDELAGLLKEPAARNFARWPILGDTVGPEYYAGNTWEEDLTYLKTWITNRIAWMDAQFVAPPVPSIPGGVVSNTNAVALTAPAAKVYYTTDGTDPRSSGGEVAPSAKACEGAVTLPASMTITTRAKRDQRWSPPITLRYVVKPPPAAGG